MTETFHLADFLQSDYDRLLAESLPSFVGFANLSTGFVKNGDQILAIIISKHSPLARQLSLQVRAINGSIYTANVKRRPGNAPSRATFRLYKKLDIPTES